MEGEDVPKRISDAGAAAVTPTTSDGNAVPLVALEQARHFAATLGRHIL